MFNPSVDHMICIRCATAYPVGEYFQGCPGCFDLELPANLAIRYSPCLPAQSQGAKVPYLFPSILGEGDTPLVSHSKIAGQYAIADFYVKNEFQNPTGSHKDRMSPFIIFRAKQLRKKGVVLASSGNAGVSMAAYAAHMDFPCVVVMTDQVDALFKKAIQALGARIIQTRTDDERLDAVRALSADNDYYPATDISVPPVGSNPFGIQGYKLIAHEILDQLKNKMPSHVLIPTGRGDLLWGMFDGFCDLKKSGKITSIPKMIAIEPIPRLERVAAGSIYTETFTGNCSKTPSIGGCRVTYQSVKAIEESSGCAVCIPPENVDGAIEQMGRSGVYLESAAAVAVKAIEVLHQKQMISETARVLMMATSHGFKNNKERTP